MYPVFLKIGPLTFYTHGIFAVLGIVFAVIVLYLLARQNLNCACLFENVIYSVLLGIIGARLTYFILYYNQFTDLDDIFFVWQGGLVSYGGFIAGALFLILVLRLQKQPVIKWFDHLAVAFPLGLFLARMGEFIAGEDFGLISPSAINFRGRIPINLLESVWCLVIFLILLFGHKKLYRSQGTLTFLLIILYTFGRFIIDFWREENRIFLFLSLGQITSFIILLASIIAYIIIKLKMKRTSHEIIRATN